MVLSAKLSSFLVKMGQNHSIYSLMCFFHYFHFEIIVGETSKRLDSPANDSRSWSSAIATWALKAHPSNL